ncbi:MAG: hypothetical protein OXC46_04880 [Thaumarchaeota archaeon]|nr:hypothetical protein [Nitrososphaerota archaeon]
MNRPARHIACKIASETALLSYIGVEILEKISRLENNHTAKLKLLPYMKWNVVACAAHQGI